MDRSTPVGVKTTAVLFYMAIVGGVWRSVRWALMLIGIVRTEASLHYSKIAMGTALLFNVGIIILLFITALGLWRGRPWSRILAISICSVVIIREITVMMRMPFLAFWAIIMIIVCSLLILYLLLNRNAIKYFEEKSPQVSSF